MISKLFTSKKLLIIILFYLEGFWDYQDPYGFEMDLLLKWKFFF